MSIELSSLACSEVGLVNESVYAYVVMMVHDYNGEAIFFVG